MAYQTALTIESVIKDIDSKKYLLPSIQREFVCGGYGRSVSGIEEKDQACHVSEKACI